MKYSILFLVVTVIACTKATVDINSGIIDYRSNNGEGYPIDSSLNRCNDSMFKRQEGFLIYFDKDLIFFPNDFNQNCDQVLNNFASKKLKKGFLLIPTTDYFETIVINKGNKFKINDSDSLNERLQQIYVLPIELTYKKEEKDKIKKEKKEFAKYSLKINAKFITIKYSLQCNYPLKVKALCDSVAKSER